MSHPLGSIRLFWTSIVIWVRSLKSSRGHALKKRVLNDQKFPMSSSAFCRLLAPKYLTKVHVVHISEIQFWETQGPSALCTFVTENRLVSLKCSSNLPADAPETQHRKAWVKDALRQQGRMPEFRNSTDIIEICPKALSFIGITDL